MHIIMLTNTHQLCNETHVSYSENKRVCTSAMSDHPQSQKGHQIRSAKTCSNLHTFEMENQRILHYCQISNHSLTKLASPNAVDTEYFCWG